MRSGRQFVPFFLSEKKTAFPPSTRHGSKPVAIPVPTSPPCLSPQAAKSGRQFVPLFLSEKRRLFRHQPARQQTRCNTRPDFSSAPLSASRKIRLTVRSAFPLRKKTVFLQSTGTAANPLQYPSRLLRPSQSMAYLVSFKFLRPVFSKRRQRFFPFFNQTFFR